MAYIKNTKDSRPTNMGLVRAKTLKKAAWVIKKYYMHMGNDFHTNKRMCEEIAIFPSERLQKKELELCHSSDEADSQRSCER